MRGTTNSVLPTTQPPTQPVPPPSTQPPTQPVPPPSSQPPTQPPPSYAQATAPPPSYESLQGKRTPVIESATPLKPPAAVPTNRQHPPAAEVSQNPQRLFQGLISLPLDVIFRAISHPGQLFHPTDLSPPECRRSMASSSEHMYIEIDD